MEPVFQFAELTLLVKVTKWDLKIFPVVVNLECVSLIGILVNLEGKHTSKWWKIHNAIARVGNILHVVLKNAVNAP